MFLSHLCDLENELLCAFALGCLSWFLHNLKPQEDSNVDSEKNKLYREVKEVILGSPSVKNLQKTQFIPSLSKTARSIMNQHFKGESKPQKATLGVVNKTQEGRSGSDSSSDEGDLWL